jgi:hypothetical protein
MKIVFTSKLSIAIVDDPSAELLAGARQMSRGNRALIARDEIALEFV